MNILQFRYLFLISFLFINKLDVNAQNSWHELAADSSIYYHDFFIHGWLLFHKQYRRLENNLIIDSIQFFNVPDTNLLDSKDITRTHLYPDKSIDRIEYLTYDENNKLIDKIDYISYSISDTCIRFNVFFFDTLRYLSDWYLINKSNLLKRNVFLSLSKDSLEDREYFLIGDKQYKMRWTQFNEQTKVGFRLYEEECYYKGDYIDYQIRNIFKDDQTILMSYKDIRYRDGTNRLILEKYHTFDSTAMDYVLDGYRKVFGAPLLTQIEGTPAAKSNSLFSNGRMISWPPDIENQLELIIMATDGKILYNTKLKERQNSLIWPGFLRPGAYVVQLIGQRTNLSKVLLKTF